MYLFSSNSRLASLIYLLGANFFVNFFVPACIAAYAFAALANDLNMPLAMIASLNEKKLRDRFDRGKINGSGDNR